MIIPVLNLLHPPEKIPLIPLDRRLGGSRAGLYAVEESPVVMQSCVMPQLRQYLAFHCAGHVQPMSGCVGFVVDRHTRTGRTYF